MRILRKILFLSLVLIFAVAVLPPTAFADIFVYEFGSASTFRDDQDPFKDFESGELNRTDAIIYRFDDSGKFLGVFGDTPDHLRSVSASDKVIGMDFHPFNRDLYIFEELGSPVGFGSGAQFPSKYVVRIFDAISGKHKKNMTLLGSDGNPIKGRGMFMNSRTGNIIAYFEDLSNPADNRGNFHVMFGDFDSTTGALIREYRDPEGGTFFPIGIHPTNGDLYAVKLSKVIRYDGLSGAFKGQVIDDGDNKQSFSINQSNGKLFKIKVLDFNKEEAEGRIYDENNGQLIRTFSTFWPLDAISGRSIGRMVYNPARGEYIAHNKGIRTFEDGQISDDSRSLSYFSRVDPENFGLMGTWGNAEKIISRNVTQFAYQPRLAGPLLNVLPYTWRGAWKYSNTSAAPEKLKFRIENEGNQLMQYSVSSSQNWLTINDPGGGQLAPGNSVDVEIQFNANADSLGVGKHKSIITFKNDSNDGGTTTRIVRLFVGSSPADISVLGQGEIHCHKRCWAKVDANSQVRNTNFTLNSGASHPVILLKTEPWMLGKLVQSPRIGEVERGVLDAGETYATSITTNPQIEDFLTLEHNPSGYILVVDKDTNDILAVDKVTVNRNGIFKPVFDKPVTSTFWQADRSTYTFVSVTHPSLSGMAPDIRLKATAFLGNRTGVFGQYSKEFTVSAGKTERLFVISGRNSNSVFFPENAGDKKIIRGRGTGTGFLRFDPVDDPDLNPGSGYPDVTMLSFWGTVVFPDTNTGFAMEFIGDLNDSSVHPGMEAGKFPAGLN